VIGSPSKEDISFVTDSQALQYLEGFKHIPRVNLKEKFPAATDEGLEFLYQCLTFNPFFRLTIDQACDHPFFADVKQEKNKNTVDPEIINLEFEDKELEEAQLRELFLAEIKPYHKK